MKGIFVNVKLSDKQDNLLLLKICHIKIVFEIIKKESTKYLFDIGRMNKTSLNL